MGKVDTSCPAELARVGWVPAKDYVLFCMYILQDLYIYVYSFCSFVRFVGWLVGWLVGEGLI